MTTDEFRVSVESWLASARHPKYGKAFDEVIYQPMLELLHYLRSVVDMKNDWKRIFAFEQ